MLGKCSEATYIQAYTSIHTLTQLLGCEGHSGYVSILTGGLPPLPVKPEGGQVRYVTSQR